MYIKFLNNNFFRKCLKINSQKKKTFKNNKNFFKFFFLKNTHTNINYNHFSKIII